MGYWKSRPTVCRGGMKWVALNLLCWVHLFCNFESIFFVKLTKVSPTSMRPPQRGNEPALRLLCRIVVHHSRPEAAPGHGLADAGTAPRFVMCCCIARPYAGKMFVGSLHTHARHALTRGGPAAVVQAADRRRCDHEAPQFSVSTCPFFVFSHRC